MDLTMLTAGIDASPAKGGADQFNAALDSMVTKTDDSVAKIKSSLSRLSREVFSLGNVIAGISFVGMIKEIMSAQMQFLQITNVLQATSSNATQAASRFEFLRKMAYSLGLELQTTARQYALLTAASKGTSLQGEKTDRVFRGISTAASALHLDASKTERIFQAVNHMMSKGVVSAQDLRRQLGNNLPGAYQLAASAMGITTQQMTAQLHAGTILAKDLLPKLADALINRYAKAAEAASNNTIGLVNKMKTALFELQVWIANNGLGDTFNNSLKKITELLRSDDLKTAVAEFSKVLAEGVQLATQAFIFLGHHAHATIAVLLGFAGLKVATFFVTMGSAINDAKKALLEFGLVQKALNAYNSINVTDKNMRTIVRNATGMVSNSSVGQAWKNHGKVNTFASGHGDMPVELEYLFSKSGARNRIKNFNTLDLRAMKKFPNSTSGGAAELMRDYNALSFVLDKNGKMLTENALKAKVAGQAYAGLAQDTKLVVSSIAQGAGMSAGVIQVGKLASGFAAARVAAVALWGEITGALATAFTAIGTAIAGVVAAITLNPLTITFTAIVAAVVAVGVAIFALRNHFLTIGGHSAKIGSYIGVVWDSVANKIRSVWNGLKDFFLTITGAIGGYWNKLSDSAIWKKAESLLSKMDFMRSWAAAAESREKYNAMDKTAGPMADSMVDHFQHPGKVNPFFANSHAQATLGVANQSLNSLDTFLKGGTKALPMAPSFSPKTADSSLFFGKLEEGLTDDGGVVAKNKPDELKKFLADQLIQIKYWKEVLALENASKKNLAQINAEKEIGLKIQELTNGKDPATIARVNAAKDTMVERQIQIDSLKIEGEAWEKFGQLKAKAGDDSTGLDRQLTYFKSLTTNTQHFKDGLEGLQAALYAYDQTADLEGKIDSKNLDQGREIIAQNYLKKKHIEELTTAQTNYYNKTKIASETIADNNATISELLAAGGNGKRNYAPFDINSPLLNAQAGASVDRELGRDKKDLNSSQYADERSKLIEAFKSTAMVTATKDLLDFTEQAKQSIGSVDRLYAQKEKLNDAFSKGLINEGDFKLVVKSMQDQFDQMVDRNLIASDRWEGGVLVALRQMEIQGQHTAEMIGAAFTQAFQTVENSIVHMLDTGKFNLDGFMTQIRHNLDTILVQKTMTGLLGPLLGNAGAGKGLEEAPGPISSISKILGFSPSGGPRKAPVGTSSDPLYVALTTGSLADTSGLPKILGGPGNGSNSGSSSSAVTETQSALNDIPAASKSLVNKIGQFGYTGLSTQGGATGDNRWMNVVTGFIKGFLGSPGLSGAFSNLFGGGAGNPGAGAAINEVAGQYGGLAPTNLSSYGSAAQNGSYSFPLFAKGGIMTSRGPISLNRYSNGGIATSPQLAMFGEGKRPEAYVPLPDGKSIPVSMSGGGGSQNVKVQHETRIYDQTGRGANVSTSNKMDGQKYVQEIFIQDLMTEGPMAQGMRSYFGAR